MRDEWIEQHVKRLTPAVRQGRLDAYIESDGSGAENCDPDVIRSELRAAIKAELQRSLGDELLDPLKEFHAIQDLGKPPSDEHNFERTRAAVAAWNQAWRKTTRDGKSLGPSLSRFHLRLYDLPDIDLRNADLGSREGELRLNHNNANLRNAALDWANLAETDLAYAVLENASLKRTCLAGADLFKTNLSGANLEGADLRNARLEEADLTGAVLRHANLTGAQLFRATLDHADLLGAQGLMLDENSVHRTRFSSRAGLIWRLYLGFFFAVQWLGAKTGVVFEHELAKRPILEDHWSSLRRTYTGPNFIITLLLFVAFIVPYLAKAFLLSEVSRVESFLIPRVESASGVNLRAAPVSEEEIRTVQERLTLEYDGAQRAFVEARQATREAAAIVVTLGPGCVGESIDSVRRAAVRAETVLDTLEGQVSGVREAVSSLRHPEMIPDAVWEARARMAGEYGAMRQTLRDASRAAQDLVGGVERLGGECIGGAAKELKEAVGRASESVKRLEQRADASRGDVGTLASGLIRERTYPIWQILLGFDTGQYAWSVLIIILFIYNVLRGFLTLTVAPMRDSEERSNITPTKLEYEKLLPFHRVVSVLYFLSLGFGAYTFVQWMTKPVIKFW